MHSTTNTDNTDTQVLHVIEAYKHKTQVLDAQFNNQKHKVATLGYLPNLQKLLITRSQMLDRCLKKLWALFTLNKDSNIALFAIGGYGRREIFPSSDLDLLILFTSQLSLTQKEKIEAFIQALWHIGTTIGHSVRSLEDCIIFAQEDHTILTSLLSGRRITGYSDHFPTQLLSHLKTNSMPSSERFYHNKKQEYRKRHHKHSNTEYNLEPNIKDAPGGLRDLHTFLWIAKYTLGTSSLTKLVRQNKVNQEEQNLLQKGYDFISSIRYCLHLKVGRDENRLLFDYQKQIATELGFTGDKKNQAVEQFMKTYYRHASTIAAVVDLQLENIQEEIINNTQSLTDQPINDRFTIIDSKIAIRNEHIFTKQPSSILELFYLLGQSSNPLGIRANTIRRLREARHQINANFRSKQENTALFLLILQSPYRLVTQLQRMKRYGILGRYLPEFGQVIGQMQYDLFHVYTVDAHALLTVKNMRLLRHTEARETFPLASKIIHTLPNQMLLYIAGLFHDIAKGRGGDHSILGATDVENFCRRHSMTHENMQLITWLVREHLIMSITAQKMDINDHKVIEEFSKKVGDHERLDYLYLLTICDIRATNPKLLNPWRLSLINQLYLETSHLFKRTLETSEHWAGRTARKRTKAIELLHAKKIDKHLFIELWNNFGNGYFSKYSAENIAWHTEAILQHHNHSEPLVIAGLTQESNTQQVYTQIFIYTLDSEHIFINSVAVFSELGLNILDARVLTSKNGYTLNTYIVDDDNTGIISGTPQIYHKICTTIKNRLTHQDALPPPMHMNNIPRAHKHFNIQTIICIHNLLESPHTVISLETLNKPGLLSLIGHIFAKHQLYLHSAKILTFGERAEDFFYVSKHQQQLRCPTFTALLYNTLHDAITK